MRSIHIIIVVLLSVFLMFGSNSKQEQFPVLEGPYLGQEPPGMTAVRFDPGIFPEGEWLGCSGFLKGATVFVFTSMKPGSDWRLRPTFVTELKEGRWIRPEVAPFNRFLPYNFTVGPDDQIIYFTSLKSPDKTTHMLLEQANIWAVKLERNGWNEPVMFGPSLNTEVHYENYPSVTRDGTVYYMSRRRGGMGRTDVYRSKNLDGVYGIAENLGPAVNSEKSDIDPFVAPDESYLIVCQDKDGGYGKWDLYAAFQKKDKSWTEPVNLGRSVNSKGSELRPYVTPDGKYLFFTGYRRGNRQPDGIYWVDAGVIEELKPRDIQ